MPLSALHLNDPAKLALLKEALTIDPMSPTYLKWREDYVTLRNSPGSPAGSLTSRKDSFVVTANRIPVHCRHAVWMLSHDRVIPDGHDVTFVDGDFRNLHPDNLTLIKHQGWKRLHSPAWRADDLPTSLTLTKDEKGIWRVILHTGKSQCVAAVVPSALDAACVAAVAAHALSYIPALPALSIDQALITMVSRVVKAYITVDPTDIRFEGAKHSFLEAVARETKRVLAPVPVAAPVAPPQASPVVQAPSDDGRAVLALIEGRDVPVDDLRAKLATAAPQAPTPAPPPFDPLQTLE
jgi:hypothetical protein